MSDTNINTIYTKKKVKGSEHHIHKDKADHDIIATLYFWFL